MLRTALFGFCRYFVICLTIDAIFILILIACHWAGDFYRLRPLRLAARRVRKQPN